MQWDVAAMGWLVFLLKLWALGLCFKRKCFYVALLQKSFCDAESCLL